MWRSDPCLDSANLVPLRGPEQPAAYPDPISLMSKRSGAEQASAVFFKFFFLQQNGSFPEQRSYRIGFAASLLHLRKWYLPNHQVRHETFLHRVSPDE